MLLTIDGNQLKNVAPAYPNLGAEIRDTKCGKIVQLQPQDISNGKLPTHRYDDYPQLNTTACSAVCPLDQESSKLVKDHVKGDTIRFPSIEHLVFKLQICRRTKCLHDANYLHALLCCYGLEELDVLGNFLVPMFVDCGDVSQANMIFDKLDQQNEHAWTSLISGYIQLGQLPRALCFYGNMQDSSIQASTHTLVAILKACSMLKDGERGRETHIQIVKQGFEQELAVGNTLVGYYANCGFHGEAHDVLEKLAVRNVVTWTAIITGYMEDELGDKAIECYRLMKLEEIAPNTITFGSILRAYGNLGDLSEGQETFTDIVKLGFEADFLIVDNVIRMYAKCGFLGDARDVFTKSAVRDAISWTALIAGYTEHGFGGEALQCFKEMKADGVLPDAIAFVSVLEGCCSLDSIDSGLELHMEIVQCGFEERTSIASSLVEMYVSFGLLTEAHDVVDELPSGCALPWTSLISGYCDNGCWQAALECYQRMVGEGVSPNAIAINCILKVCGNVGALESGLRIHDFIVQEFRSSSQCGNALVGMYSKSGSLLEAVDVFENIPNQDTVLWTTLMSGCADHGAAREALTYYDAMQQEGALPDAVTFSCVLKACGSAGALEKGKDVHRTITLMGYDREPSVNSCLISMYAKGGSMFEAHDVFDEMRVQDVVAWSALIRGYGMNHDTQSMEECYQIMREQGVKPNAITFMCLLTACSHASLLSKGQVHFKEMVEDFGIEPTQDHFSSLIDLLGRSGLLFEAERLLEMLHPPSRDMWAALISACQVRGEVELGERCFQQLMSMCPDDASWYVLMADIYIKAGRWVDASAIEDLRLHAEAKKRAAFASIEVGKRVHEFRVGEEPSSDVSSMLHRLMSEIEEEGHVPDQDVVSWSAHDERSHVSLCMHAEKLAIAFGLLHIPQGQTLRVTKNLKMCNDCHGAFKGISRVRKRDIILRDNCCIHHFKNGFCSCGDMF